MDFFRFGLFLNSFQRPSEGREMMTIFAMIFIFDVVACPASEGVTCAPPALFVFLVFISSTFWPRNAFPASSSFSFQAVWLCCCLILCCWGRIVFWTPPCFSITLIQPADVTPAMRRTSLYPSLSRSSFLPSHSPSLRFLARSPGRYLPSDKVPAIFQQCNGHCPCDSAQYGS